MGHFGATSETAEKPEAAYVYLVAQPPIDHETIRESLRRVLTSDSFSRSPQARRFLEYIVEQTLLGEEHLLKAYTIGVAALGASDDRSHPETTARMQASRVRKLLEKYYETQGETDVVRLELPIGSYQPRFRSKDRETIPPSPSSMKGESAIVGVGEFEPRSALPEDHDFCRALRDGIIAQLVHAPELRVTRQSTPGEQVYVLNGSLTRAGSAVRVLATLVHPSGETIWSERFDQPFVESDFLPALDALTSTIACQIGDPAVGAVARAHRESPKFALPGRAMAAFYRFLANPSGPCLDAARTLLEESLKDEGGGADLHAALSCVLSLHYLGAPPSRGPDLLLAEKHARLATTLESASGLAHLAKALVHYHHREKSHVEREVLRAVELSRVSPLVRAAAGNLLCLVGCWSQGLELVEEAQRVSPRLPGYLNLGRCLYFLHERGEAARALAVTELLDMDGSALAALLRVACLSHLGRTADARRAISLLVTQDRTIAKRLPRQLSDLFLDSRVAATLLAAAKDAGLGIRGEAPATDLRYHVARTQRPLRAELRVGILQSLSGTMAISEAPLVNAAMLAVDEINAAGGILGQPVRAIVADGASDPGAFRDQAERLISKEGVTGLFGCWTSSSRKAVRPVVERHDSLLWYPMQYEGLEGSRNIVYTGSCLNQQIEPALRWASNRDLKRCLLIGSDYVFPRTANRLIRALVEASGGTVLAESYERLGAGDFRAVARQIEELKPDIVYNTVNGSDNIALLSALRQSGISPEQSPVMSFSLSELELAQAGTLAVGHYACWSYFQSLDTPVNRSLVARFRARYGENEVLSDPMVTAYAQLHLYRDVVTRAGSVDTSAVLANLAGCQLDLGGEVLKVVGNHHVHRGALIGRVRSDQQFDVVWRSGRSIAPQPWLGVDEVDFLTRDLVLAALSALPEMAERHASLEGQMAQLLP